MNIEYLPSPSEIWRAFVQVLDESLPADLLFTVAVASCALAIALVLGGTIGLAIGLFPRVRQNVMGTIDFHRTIPAVALIPLAALVLGPASYTEVALATYAASWPVILATAEGVRSVHPRLIDCGNSLRLGRVSVIRRIVIPAVLPYWLDSARLSALAALHVAITTEMIIGQKGLGYSMVRYLNGLAPAPMWAYAIVCGVVGVVVSETFRWLATRRHTAELARVRFRIPWWGLWPIAAVLALWQIAGNPRSIAFPPPLQWLDALSELGGRLVEATSVTLLTYGGGLAVAMAVGVTGGLVFGSVRIAERLAVPALNLLVAVPASALIPILLLLLGFGPIAGIAIGALVATWPVLLICTSARRLIPAERLDVSRTLNVGTTRTLFRVVLPSMLPGVMLAAKLGSALALIAALLSDIFGSGRGLGRLLIESHQTFDAPLQWGLLVVIGVIGYLSSTTLTWLERSLTPRARR